jgi:pyrimidine-nucleoside phosphorylase
MVYEMYEIISRKRDGLELSRDEIAHFISGYIQGTIPDYQAAALLMAIYLRGLTTRELGDLTDLMMHSGESIDLGSVAGVHIDKHSTGGVGDKISFVLSPLVAACGVKVPMLSGRGLGHTGGTLDKLEAIPGMRVFLTQDEFRAALAKTGMAICGQTDNIVPADKKLYALRDATATVSCIPLIASSIMSKKLALGSHGIMLDVKTGSGAFMRREEDSIALCRTMVDIGEQVGRRTVGLITSMDQPMGQAVGNALEMIESFECLKGRGPADVMEVAYAMGGEMLLMANAAPNADEARRMLEQAIASGRALAVLRDYIATLGGDARVCDDYSLFPTAQAQVAVTAARAGVIAAIDSFAVGMAAIDTGAGRRRKDDKIDHAGGFTFHAHVGDPVEKGQTLVTVHGNPGYNLPAVAERVSSSIRIGDQAVAKPKMVLHLIDKTGVKPWS